MPADYTITHPLHGANQNLTMSARPRIAVLTAVHPSSIRYLRDAAQSVARLQGVDAEWLVQVDGTEADADEVRALLSGLEADIQANGRHLGTAITRNRALGRANAPLAATLDADDLLEPRGLRALADALQTNPGAAFAFGRGIDFFPDGHSELATRSSPYPLGAVPRRAIEDHWLRTGWDGIFFASICWRTEVLFEIGGWSALPGMEDTDLALDASHRFSAYHVPELVLRYRVHADQTTLSRAYWTDRAANRKWIWRRVNARRFSDGLEQFELPPDASAVPSQSRARRLRGE